MTLSRPNFGPKLGPRFSTEFLPPPPNYIGKVVAIFMGPWPHCHRLFRKVVFRDGASPTSSLHSVSNENRFQFLVYRESKITYHIPDKQLKLSQKHKCGAFMWLNTTILMSSYRRLLEAYRINIWANVFPMIYCYVFIFRNPHTMKPILTRESNWICFR